MLKVEPSTTRRITKRELNMNKHIALVKRYLAGEGVTTEELRANSIAASAAAEAAEAAEAAHAADTAHADTAHTAAAAFWIKRYKELTNE